MSRKAYRRPRGPEDELPLEAHLEELADRLKKAILALLAVFVIVTFIPYDLEQSYIPLVVVIAKAMAEYVLPPSVTWMGQEYNVTIIYTGPFEGFSVLLYSSLLVSLLITSPYIAYQIYAFVEPALYEHEKRKLRGGAVAAVGLFILGAGLGFFVVAPISLRIMLMLQAAPVPTENLLISVTMSKLLDFIIKITLTTGLAFEIPLVIYYLMAFGIIEPRQVKGRNSRIAFLIILTIAAIITPDPSGLTMIILAVPYYLVFLIGVHFGEKAYYRNVAKALELEGDYSSPSSPSSSPTSPRS